jgi:hypothetical protein
MRQGYEGGKVQVDLISIGRDRRFMASIPARSA